MNEIIQVRRNIGDPVASDFILVEDFPDNPLHDAAYTKGDGVYQYFDGAEWRLYYLKFSDNYIKELVSGQGVLKASIKLIDNLIARIDPADFLTGGEAGGQSLRFASLAEVIAYYNELRDRLFAEDAAESGMNSGLILETKRRSVGGVLEYE